MTNKKNIKLLTAGIALILVAWTIAAYSTWTPINKTPPSELIRVACIGDSLTQGSAYPYDLWEMLGSNGPFTIGNFTLPPVENSSPSNNLSYAVGNFGAGGTMVTLKSETPYMNTSEFQKELSNSSLT